MQSDCLLFCFNLNIKTLEFTCRNSNTNRAVATVRNTRRFLFLYLSRGELGAFLNGFDGNIFQASLCVISNTQTFLKIKNIPRCLEIQPLLQMGG